MISAILTANPLAFAVEEVLRQAHAMRRAGDTPIRVRIGHVQWMNITRDPDIIRIQMTAASDDPPTFCGLPVRVDREWGGPIAVESVRDQKPS